eukprot:CAMPEP_0170320508 /NCGR_PEP_ID=MMETSP0116_2-20130129/60993_1 /TAXON_ID=400756 /ORGANISM="Durinskia baltica, Strain CSIRO CS-38" /LENGTH=647 /DNA_ID=CAMNT_0010573289 /DNA_START=67 /DNA_END=2010 /DNA_ORIENTATION=-
MKTPMHPTIDNTLPLMRRATRKRARCCTSLFLVAAATTVLRPVNAFLPASSSAGTKIFLEAGRSAFSEEVMPLTPKTASSSKRREEAVKAMKRTKVDTALDGIDAQMLELLSEKFLYPDPTPPVPPKPSKPRGRPDFVPGAMKFETMLKFQEQGGMMGITRDSSPTTNVKTSPIEEGIEDEPIASSSKHSKIRGSASISTIDELPENVDESRPRKRVVKNLPQRKEPSDEAPVPKQTIKGRAKANNLELQKYYRTQLLTADEEYTLGMQIQLMIKCEQVHEGLATELMRLPTIEEWAQACGYTDECKNFRATEGMEQIRPSGCDAMFEEVDPNMFVGNGLAMDAGPGRGRGRAKKAPPIKLKDFFDRKDGKKGLPLNRGTAMDFVDMMLEGREAKQRMVQSNMRLVVSIARKYSNVGVGLQDLVQEGSIGLSRAAEKFDPSKGFKFSTYASWWIQQAVFRSIAYHSRTIRLPVHVHNLLNRVRKVKNTLQRDLGRQPTNEEMAEALDMSLGKYNKMLRLTRRSISLELPKYQSNPKDLGHESEDLLGETISTSQMEEDEATPEKGVDRSLFHDDLQEMLSILDDDEREVIQYRYGLADGLTRTVTAVAAQMKQSKAWVRSQECKALRKLRRPWYEKKLKEHQQALTC